MFGDIKRSNKGIENIDNITKLVFVVKTPSVMVAFMWMLMKIEMNLKLKWSFQNMCVNFGDSRFWKDCWKANHIPKPFQWTKFEIARLKQNGDILVKSKFPWSMNRLLIDITIIWIHISVTIFQTIFENGIKFIKL